MLKEITSQLVKSYANDYSGTLVVYIIYTLSWLL